MQIDKVVKTKDGNVRFKAKLTAEELGFLLHIAITYLCNVGALAVIEGSDTEGLDEVPNFDDIQLN